MKKLTFAEFCDSFNGDCDGISCNHCKTIFDKIRQIEKNNSSVTNDNTCDWCGKDGELITKHYHRECHEAVLNGDGLI